VSFPVTVRRHVVAAIAMALAAVALLVPSHAGAVPAHTDVMFVFDTTGSMGGAIEEAQGDIQEAMTQIGASLPDAQFGLVEVNDYDEVNNPGFFSYGIGEGFPAWALKVPITSNQAAIVQELEKMEAEGGGDGPEAYGRALNEVALNPAIGWRAGARGVVVVVADNVPHDNELNDGIPSEVWYESPFDTGVDPGADNTVGTGDDLDWQAVLGTMIAQGKPLEYVDYFGEEGFFPYWQNWAGRTGGAAVQASEGNLANSIVEVVKAGASAALPACPAGQVRDASEHCVAAPPPPSNNFKIELRTSCSKGCHVIEVKIFFDSAGKVIMESVLEEKGAGASSVAVASKTKKGCKTKCRPKPLIRRLSKTVVPGLNKLKLKLTGSAIKKLNKKGKLNVKVRTIFTPTGGTPLTKVNTLKVKLPKKPAAKKRRK